MRDQPRLDPRWVAARFDRIASVYWFFEFLFLIPRRLRPRAVTELRLKPGARVISVGCGQGPSLPLLAAAVGPTGHVIGVDLSPRMLERAVRRCQRAGLGNVELLLTDINQYTAPAPLDAALFSFSLTTFGDPRTVLQRVWEQLRPGGRLVVMDAQVPPGLLGRLSRPLLPVIRPFLEATVLGDPDMHPIDELRALGSPVGTEFLFHGAYFIASATKPIG